MSDTKDARLMNAAELAELDAQMLGRGRVLASQGVLSNSLNVFELNKAEIASLDRMVLNRGDFDEADRQSLYAAYKRQYPIPFESQTAASPSPLPRSSASSWPEKDARLMSPAEFAELDARMKNQS